jgi:hypothetical protein
MSEETHTELHRQLSRLGEHVPDFIRRLIEWVRRPNAKYVRVPIAILLILGGFVGFLPILGFWMIPLGLALLALDVPFLQRPLTRLLGRVVEWLERRRDAKRDRPNE